MIDFQQTIDATMPVFGPHYVQEYRDKGRTPVHGDLASSITETGGGRFVFGFRRGGNGTATSSERRHMDAAAAVSFPAAGGESSALEAASEARIALLAQKYEGKATKEGSARLAILTERIRRLSPRVTSSDLSALGEVVGELEDISTSIADLRSEFGI